MGFAAAQSPAPASMRFAATVIELFPAPESLKVFFFFSVNFLCDYDFWMLIGFVVFRAINAVQELSRAREAAA